MSNKLYVIILALFCWGISSSSLAETTSLQGLLNDVKRISENDAQINRQREATFKADLTRQQVLLQQSQQRLAEAESEQEALQAQFDANDLRLAELTHLLQQRSGQLGEVFGVAREAANNLSSTLQDSIISAEYPQRMQALAFAQSKRVPQLQDIQALWYQLQLQMTASGEIKPFSVAIINAQGEEESSTVLRVGNFTAVTDDGRFLAWDSSQQQLFVLPTQPAGGHQQAAIEYQQGVADQLLIDPSRGSLFLLLDRMPKLSERLKQGGEVGYLIMLLGVVGLLVALYQVARMALLSLRLRQQLKTLEHPLPNNPLGRVLATLKQSQLSFEQLENKVDEAVLKELPAIESGQSMIKLLAAVAPLLGLLGTVVGMIATFQSITLFGSGDPKLMAGGISQALMTTVLGLIVAIPLLFCHSYLASKSRRICQLLQEKSLGLLSQQAECDDKGSIAHAA